MPTASTIAINDGQATPVSHNFDPQSITPSNAVFVNGEATTSAGKMKAILGFSPANGQRNTDRVSIRFNMPIEQTVDGITTVAYTARFIGEWVLPDSMTQAERDDFQAYVSNLVAHTSADALVADLDPQY